MTDGVDGPWISTEDVRDLKPGVGTVLVYSERQAERGGHGALVSNTDFVVSGNALRQGYIRWRHFDHTPPDFRDPKPDIIRRLRERIADISPMATKDLYYEIGGDEGLKLMRELSDAADLLERT